MQAGQAVARGRAEIAQAALWLGFFGLILALWALTWRIAAATGGGWLCLPGDVAAMPFGGFPALLAMWAAMTAAMMLPTLVPTLTVYLALPARARPGPSGAVALVAGYLAVWSLGAAAFALAQSLLIRAGALGPAAALTSPLASAALLVGAGLWQFSAAKTACQTACLRPEIRFLAHLTPGLTGAATMGIRIGLACIGCCWALMALAFVGGAMSLLWMGLATAFMVLEKLPALGAHLRRPAGAALILAGLALPFAGGPA
jgi:predicted metal-binding membrane protein